MEQQQQTVATRRRKRRIIERPRLFRALDGSKARVRMLIAPAGFGKTTLAEQWTRMGGRTAAWYPARNASADVAALAVGIGAVAAGLIPGCDRRLRERLTATQSPSDEVDVLAELLAEDVAAWPAEAWLVVDDYHLLCRAAEAELFVKLLVRASPVNLLLSSRRRPSWVSSRDILYGGVLELNQTELAMSRDEAEEVLGIEDERSDLTPGLVALANGWPAVIALAGVSGVPELPGEDVPEALYDFFAEEIYRGLEPDVRVGLGVLSVASALDRELATELLGAEAAERSVAEGLAIGVLDERGDRLELHPLARTFVESKAVVEAPAERAAALGVCLRAYRERRDWDAAFDLVERHELADELEGLLAEALDELLEAARLATIEAWVVQADRLHVWAPVFPIARAELCLRAGKNVTAQALAERALRDLEPGEALRFRALMLAAESAHVGSREEIALEFFRCAEMAAASTRQGRDALWGQMMCLAELEHEDAFEVLSALTAESVRDDPRDLVRQVTRQLGFELRAGAIESLDRAVESSQLLEYVSDVFVRTSFRSILGVTLALTADYAAARQVSYELLEDIDAHRMDFAKPYALCVAAGAEAGLHQFDNAERLVAAALEEATRQGNLQARLNSFAAQLRIFLHQGRVDEVCAGALFPQAPVRSLQGELLGIRGLAVACAGRPGEALQFAQQAAEVTKAVEAKVLSSAIRAIVALKSGDSDIRQHLEELIAVGYRTQAFDLIVTAYRACPELLTVLLKAPTTRDQTWSINARAGDEELVKVLNLPTPKSGNLRTLLSLREQEVYDLVCQGLSNRQIARCLFISEATVKVHVHHVFDKTGIRSRTALALNAARQQMRQATSAMGAFDGATDPLAP